MINKKIISQAIELARRHSFRLEGGPFGAIVFKKGKIISTGWNEVLKTNDPTAHAEINAIRKACKKFKTYDLSGCEIYSTTEPCPMCLAAIYWSKISRVYYGNTRHDAAKIGFADDFIYREFAKPAMRRKFDMKSGMGEKEVNALFEKWGALENKIIY